jgi:hypothetical protein
VVRCSPQAVSEEEALQKLYQTLNEWKIRPYMSVLKVPPKVSRRISSFRNFLSFNDYFRKYFKLVYRKNMVMATLSIGIMFPLFTCMHFWVWGILWRWSAFALTAYEVVRDCRNLRTTALRYITCAAGTVLWNNTTISKQWIQANRLRYSAACSPQHFIVQAH